MNLASGVLMIVGFLFLVAAAFYRLTDIALLKPLVLSTLECLSAANVCFLLAIIVDRFQKD